MGSLFTGTPQTATSYTTTSSETPKWLQDAIYNQIQLATNVANTPYQAYTGQQVAGLSPLQQQAYSNIQANQGAWKPAYQAAVSGMAGLEMAPGQAASAQPYLNQQSSTLGSINYNAPISAMTPYLNQAISTSGISAAQPYFGSESGLLGGINYNAPTSTLSPYVNQALATSGANAANPYLSQATNLSTINAAQPYLSQASGLNAVSAAQPYMSQAGNINAVNAASPYLNQATNLNTVSSAEPYLSQAASATGQGLSGSSLSAAQPYLSQAGQSSVANINQYMNPYQQNVMDMMATQAARNLSEKLLPAVSDEFIRAGQFGGTRMGEFGSRALRDTQQALLQEQGALAQQGYNQGLAAAQADLSRQTSLAGTAGQLSSADLARAITAGGQYANLGQTAGQLTQAQQAALQAAGATTGQLSSQQLQNLANLGQTQGQLTQAQQNALANIGQTAGQLTQAQQAALQAAGSTLGNLTQAQQQAILQGGQALSTQQQNAINQALSAAGQYGTMGQAAGQLTNAQQQALLQAGTDLATQQQNAIGQMLSGAGQYGTMAQNAATMTGADLTRQQSALTQLANMAAQGQQLSTADAAALESAGQAQQANTQQQLDAAYQQYLTSLNYPKTQLDWLNTQIRGMAPNVNQTQTNAGTTTGQTYSASPLSQLASAYSLYKGLTG